MKVTLREHFEAILIERDKRNEQRFQSQGEAVRKAESALNSRLDLLNELRGDVATKSQIQATDQRVQDIVSRLDRIEGKSSGISSSLVMAISIATLLAGAIGLYFKHGS